MHNAKFDLTGTWKLLKLDYNKIKFHDTMIMSRLLRNTARDHSLDGLAYELGEYPKDLDKVVKNYGLNYADIPKKIMTKYQRSDVIRTMLLFRTFYPEIKKNKKLHIDYLEEIKTIKATMKMEIEGIKIDVKSTKDLAHKLENDLYRISNRLKNKTGHYINLSSGKQIVNLLYENMGLPVIHKTDKGNPCTKKETIFELRTHYKKTSKEFKVLDIISEYRSYEHSLGMIKSYLKFKDKKDIIHTTINTNQAKTGRQSSKDPNLMAVSKKENYFNPYIVPLRKLFIPTSPRKRTYLVDYSGIEMRLILAVADEKKMIKVLESGGNMHSVACKIFFKDDFISKSESKILYDAGKNAHFAIPYGATLPKIIIMLNIGEKKGRRGFFDYRDEFPKISNLSTTTAKQAREQGYIETLFGRRLYIKHRKWYTAINYQIQGTGAQLLKRSENRIHKYINDNYVGKLRMVLPVHDEIILEADESIFNEEKRYTKDISNLMTNFPELKVPLEVEWSYSNTNWNDKQDLILN